MFRILPILALSISAQLEKVSFSDLPNLAIDTNTAGLESKVAFQSALKKQLEKCLVQPFNETWDFAGKKITRKQWCIKNHQMVLS